MESFHWDENFITGLSIVDEQHHHLVQITNRLGSYLAEDKIVFDNIKEVFLELFDYADYHFREEEKMMSKIGVDRRHFDSHLEGHKYFLEEITSMYGTLSPDNLHTTPNMLDFLTRWLAYHILGDDQNMARQIEAIKHGSSPDNAYKAEEQRIADSTEPLVSALNSLFQKVTIRNKELRKLNKSLEDKVEDRTKALLEANLHLEKISMTDALTGLPNRRFAMQQFADIWETSSAVKSLPACLMIDADHFKEVNDNYGHHAGDIVLKGLANTLRITTPNDAIVCRLGGDEFLVICPDTDLDGAMHISEHIRNEVSKLHISTGDGVWCGSISIGVAVRSPGMKNYADMIKTADISVYEAKRSGKNCVRAISL